MFNLNLSNVPEEKRVSWTKHRVQRGDSLDNIAIRYHTTVNLIKQVNQLTNNRVQPNQSILIPSSKNSTVIAKSHEIRSPVSILKPLRDVKPLLMARDHRVIHIVQTSDSFQTIQRIYGVTLKEILTWNKLAANQVLHPGQQLVIWKKIKAIKSYSVKNGDTLSSIARAQQTKVDVLLKLNPNVSKNTPLHLGQKIIVG
jgi:membrane-bound lytic murein transglycosylase D